jgi:hypothetical protein
MIGLGEDVAAMFAALVVPIEDGYIGRPIRRLFRLDDRHRDAERWLAASEEEREAMRPSYERLLADRIREAARTSTPRPQRKRSYVNDREKARLRNIAFRQRRRASGSPSRYSTLTDEQRERQRDYVRACRARKSENST